LAFPLRIGDDGRYNTADRELKFLTNIEIILKSVYDSRVMRPNMGADLTDYIFSNPSDSDLRNVELIVKEALAQYEPRITVVGVAASLVDEKIAIRVDFKIKSGGLEPVYSETVTL
jgi:phage baseplate assembly protein W